MDDIENFLISQRNKLQTDKNNLVLHKKSLTTDDKQIQFPINFTISNNNNDEKSLLEGNKINGDEDNKKDNHSPIPIMDFLQTNGNDAIELLTNADATTKTQTNASQAGIGCVQSANMCKVNSPSIATTLRSPMSLPSTSPSPLPLTLLSPSPSLSTKHNQQISIPQGVLDSGSGFQIYNNLGNQNQYYKCADKTVKNLTNLNERQSVTTADNTKDVAGISKYRVNKDDMEQWVSDTFYSYFPGFNNENKKRQTKLQDRQLEYQQNFLKHQMNEAAANVGKKKNKNQTHEDANSKQQNIPSENIHHKPTTTTTPTPSTSRSSDKTDLEIIVNNPDYEIKSPRPGSARYKHLQDLKHTDLSTMVNNDGVTERNRRNAEMEMAKKKNYQRELMAQIEEHRRSIEVLREKERRQDEALTRRLEEQLKTMRLQEELEKEKMRADKMRFDSEQNRLMREHLLNKLETDTKALEASVHKTQSEISKITPQKNKVYKYFSNSARHEFRRDSSRDRLEESPFHVDLPQPTSSHQPRSPRKKCFHNNIDDSSNVCPFCNESLKSYESWCLKCEKRILDESNSNGGETDSLICANCKKLYSVCSKCDDDVKDASKCCVHCKRLLNFCPSCEKNLCSDCVDSIAVAKDGHHHHSRRQKTDSERSFEILEVNYPEHDDEAANDVNNNPHERNRPPFSINIDRNSIFHQNYDRPKIYDDENNIDKIRHQTDKQLSRYLKNYGDLACKGLRDRSTQTTPDSASRRDIVMVEENNLSMPLLREMPRMTRKESNFLHSERQKKSTRIESLARRWEVPAVQKHTITTNSPKVLTQLGAIRKQLQSDQLQLDF